MYIIIYYYNTTIHYNYNIIKLVPIHLIDKSFFKCNTKCLGSYEFRCIAAVTAYDEGAYRLFNFNKHKTDKSLGMCTKYT